MDKISFQSFSVSSVDSLDSAPVSSVDVVDHSAVDFVSNSVETVPVVSGSSGNSVDSLGTSSSVVCGVSSASARPVEGGHPSHELFSVSLESVHVLPSASEVPDGVSDHAGSPVSLSSDEVGSLSSGRHFAPSASPGGSSPSVKGHPSSVSSSSSVKSSVVGSSLGLGESSVPSSVSGSSSSKVCSSSSQLGSSSPSPGG